MPKVTITDLFAKIGQLTVENEALRADNDRMAEMLAVAMGEPAPSTGDEDVPSEVPSAVSGPDDNAGLV